MFTKQASDSAKIGLLTAAFKAIALTGGKKREVMDATEHI
jgi:hypothetical protein